MKYLVGQVLNNDEEGAIESTRHQNKVQRDAETAREDTSHDGMRLSSEDTGLLKSKTASPPSSQLLWTFLLSPRSISTVGLSASGATSYASGLSPLNQNLVPAREAHSTDYTPVSSLGLCGPAQRGDASK